jgi:hypothetical protein
MAVTTSPVVAVCRKPGGIGYMVAMAHPRIEFERKGCEKLSCSAKNLDLCVTIFTSCRRFISATKIDCDQLHSITNTKDRRTDLIVESRLDSRRTSSVTLDGPPTGIHPSASLRRSLCSESGKDVSRNKRLLTHPPCDELRILRAEIENQY